MCVLGQYFLYKSKDMSLNFEFNMKNNTKKLMLLVKIVMKKDCEEKTLCQISAWSF